MVQAVAVDGAVTSGQLRDSGSLAWCPTPGGRTERISTLRPDQDVSPDAISDTQRPAATTRPRRAAYSRKAFGGNGDHYA